MDPTNIFDPEYVRKQQIASLQRMAAEQNALRVQRYKQASADWIASNTHGRDMGLPLTPLPTVPRKIVVDDAGEWRELPFDGLAAPELPVFVPPQTGNPFIGKLNPNAETDRHAQIMAALQLLNSKLDAALALAREKR